MQTRFYNLTFLCFFNFLFLSGGCTSEKKEFNLNYQTTASSKLKIKRFAIHPLHNPTKLSDVFGPLIQYLNKNIPEQHFELEASTSYKAFDEKLKNHEPDFILPNPYQTLEALESGYTIFAKMGDDENFRGILIVRKDSDIKNIKDLKGKTISYPAATALAATMMPQYYLYQHGLDVMNDTKSLYVGSQESSIMNVYLKNSQAGGTWPPPWKAFVQANPEKASAMEVRWTTESLPNNSLMARKDIPKELVDQVKSLLLHLHESEEGRSILLGIGLNQFEVADQNTYLPVKNFLKTFEAKIRSPNKESK